MRIDSRLVRGAVFAGLATGAVACSTPEPYRSAPDAADTGTVVIGSEPAATDSDELYRTDAQLRADVNAALAEAGYRTLDVRVINGDVYLEGLVSSAARREEAERLAGDVVGVEEVFGRNLATW